MIYIIIASTYNKNKFLYLFFFVYLTLSHQLILFISTAYSAYHSRCINTLLIEYTFDRICRMLISLVKQGVDKID